MLMPSIFGERFFDDLFDFPTMDFPEPPKGITPHGRLAHPMKTDVEDKEDHYEITIDLPGFKKDDVTAELKDGYLTVSATQNEDREEKDENGKFIRRERFFGNMQRSYYVSDNVTEDEIGGKFEDGTLKLNVPKAEPKKVEDTRRLVAIEG